MCWPCGPTPGADGVASGTLDAWSNPVSRFRIAWNIQKVIAAVVEGAASNTARSRPGK
jgi:hypothetical protein